MGVATRIARAGAVLLAAALLSACASMGVRPGFPKLAENDTPCTRYEKEFNYTVELQEAYHTRASQNRAWIYIAGILALGTTAATGGLAALGGAAVALTALSLSGGFASGSFALIDNQTLAAVYTSSANRLAEGLRDAEKKADFDGGTRTGESCESALVTLAAARTTAQTELETARSNASAAAMIRAREETTRLDELSTTLQQNQIARRLQGAQISGPEVLTDPAYAELLVSGADLSIVQLGAFEVHVGSSTTSQIEPRPLSAQRYALRFRIPAAKPDETDPRRVALVIRSAGVTLEAPKTLPGAQAAEPVPPVAPPNE